MAAQNSEHRNGRMERPIFLLRRQWGAVINGQIPLAFQAVEPQRYLVGMLPRGGDTAEVCIIRVPVRHGYAFAVDDFIIWRALVQGEPQPQRQDLPVGVEGRDNIYSFGHTDHLYFIIQTYVRKINRENSDLTPQLIGSTTSADGTISSANFSKYRFLIVRIGAGGWSRTEFFINQSYIGAFYALDNTADQRIRLDYNGTKIKLSGYSGGSFNICEAYGFVLK